MISVGNTESILGPKLSNHPEILIIGVRVAEGQL